MSIVQTLACACALALFRLCRKLVDIDLGQRAQHGEGQLAPGRGKVDVLSDRDERDAVFLEMVEGFEQPLQVAEETVDRVDDDYVEQSLLGVVEELC